MANIIIGERVINKAGEEGTIVSFDGQYVCVDYRSRVARLKSTAFEEKHIRYADRDLQEEVNADIARTASKEVLAAEKRRAVIEKEKEDRAEVKSRSSPSAYLHSATVNLEPAPISYNSVRKRDADLIRKIFTECDKDIRDYYDAFVPRMKYTASYSKSRYNAGFLTKYSDCYVLRVFSRNDFYKAGAAGGVVVMKSTTTETFRIVSVNGRVYYFSKNLSRAGENANTSLLHGAWHVSDLAGVISLDEVMRRCDCGYLNGYIAEQNVNCLQYARLLMSALYSNKAEIVFKWGLFSSIRHIDNLVDYLEEYTSKQIDLACQSDAINTLPIIKRYGVVDPFILRRLEGAMKLGRAGESIYTYLSDVFRRLGIDCPDFDKRLIGFVRRVERFDPMLYRDYLSELSQHNGVTVGDFFDKDYIEKHNIMMREKLAQHSDRDDIIYSRVAEGLAWIDREENGYFITVPKTISEFIAEGRGQHNCVYTNRYYRYVIQGYSIIVFLRQQPDTSYVTVEFDFDTFEVLQAYGKYNREISEELYGYIVDLGKRLYHERSAQH